MNSFFQMLLLAISTRKDDDLVHKIHYLTVENKIVSQKLPARITITQSERNRLMEAARTLGPLLKHVVQIVHPSTMLRWFREDKKGRSRKKPVKRGRRRTAEEIRLLIIKLRKENNWRFDRIWGELPRLGVRSVSKSTIKRILKAAGLTPCPKSRSDRWDKFLKRHVESLWQCDFLIKKVVTCTGLRDAFVLVFLHAKTRRVILSPATRKTLLSLVRAAIGVRSRQAHIVLLKAEGWSHRQIRSATFASFDFIGTTLRLFRRRQMAAFAEPARRRPLPPWARVLRQWVAQQTPADFGYFRTRWSCATLAHTLAFELGVHVSTETVRRMLHRLGYGWRRPRPVVGPTDPEYAVKLQAIQELLRTLSPDEVAVFQDEVDIHLNPMIGSAWMKRGRQAEVVTPGNNQKRHLAGSLDWRTGELVVGPPGMRRNTELYLEHLDELRRRFRHARHIHVICDNAAFHKSRAVARYLEKWGHRIDLHFLPCYAPETNPIERVWWTLHETLTRNHRCPTLDDLLCDVYTWINNRPAIQNPELQHYATAA